MIILITKIEIYTINREKCMSVFRFVLEYNGNINTKEVRRYD